MDKGVLCSALYFALLLAYTERQSVTTDSLSKKEQQIIVQHAQKNCVLHC